MEKQEDKEVLDVTIAEIDELRKAVEESDFSQRHKAILLTLIEEIVSLKKNNQKKATQINRLKRLLGSSSEKKSSKNRPSQPNDKKTAKNHGRNGCDAYRPSKVIPHSHQKLHLGQNCPECNHGTLVQLRPGKVIRIVGNAPIEAHLHEPERLRCGGCGKVFCADLPEETAENKADATANSVLAYLHYGMGLPFYRLAAIQKTLGVPLPASTQYEMLELLWTQIAPVFKMLLQIAAGWPLMFLDDTPSKVLDFIKEKESRKKAKERVGVFTTAIIARNAEHEIHLFFTGRKHAGENLGELLKQRDENSSPPIQMSDALSGNLINDHLTVVALCLVHARRNIIDCEDSFPDEAAYMIERFGTVFKNERETKRQNMDNVQRLEYHQKHSQKPINEIKAYAEDKFETREVEPNSPLGQSFQYLLKHWSGLTRFLEIPGAPLENNEAERLIKRFILYRKNSMFYKTENGARVGDCIMSILQTCIAADENPMDYLTQLQRNSKHVAKNPQLWLPWNYRNTLKSVNPGAAQAQQ